MVRSFALWAAVGLSRPVSWFSIVGLLIFVQNLCADEIGVRVPDGFEVIEFAGDELAHDVYSMTIDSKGRVVVAGAGYVKTLVDNDGDGKADEAKLFSEFPKSGAHGMYFNGRSLICIGDGGILRLKDADGDDKADGPPELFLKVKTGGEHDVHSIQLGPDGWWYVIAGNSAGINGKYATLPSSPITAPRAGVLMRLKPDLKGGELLADGYRNPYDFAFNAQGDIFAYDSDEEREISLPWYRPTRVYHSLIGADHGWVSKSWMRRDGYFDMPPAIASLGRGSPTGVACYRHDQFPEKYRGALFVLDWTYGRVHALPLNLAGDTWTTEPELFMTGEGQNGFAPTDAEVGSDGSLYVCVGGRGTRGAVYRIRHKVDANANVEPKSLDPPTREEQISKVLKAHQPLSSWSRTAWRPVAMELGPLPFKEAALNESLPAGDRIRAIEILVELFQGLDTATLKTVASSQSPGVRARAIWAYGRHRIEPLDADILNLYLDDPSPLVGRCTLEVCLNLNPTDIDWSKLVVGLTKRLGGPNRFNRTLAAGVVTKLDEKFLVAVSAEATKMGPRAVVSYAFGWLVRSADGGRRLRSAVPRLALSILKKSDSPVELKQDAIRLFQMSLGDLGPAEGRASVFDGYAASLNLQQFDRELDPLRVGLATVFPTGDVRLDDEIVRLFAMLTTFSEKVIDAICDRLTDDSDPVDDIHQLVALARCPMTHTVKQRDKIVLALVNLEEKLSVRKLPQDASWADRVKEMWLKLALADQFLAPAIVGHAKFGRPGHTIFLNQMPPELLPVARNAFVKMIENDSDYPWNNDVVFALGESNDPVHRNLIRQQFERFPVRGAVLVVLSRKPEAIDRDKFVAGLAWSQSEVQTACLSALENLGPNNGSSEQIALVKALRRLGADDAEYAARERVVRLLERNNKKSFPFEKGKTGYRPQPETSERWTALIEARFPKEAATELGGNEAEVVALKTILAETDWSKGDADRGAELFAQRSCRQCHNGRTALGPDLGGVASRFSREDLFTSIIVPSRDVSTRYQTTLVQTRDGKQYSGLIIYESVDGFLIRNGTGQTFRIEANQVEEKHKSPVSLMPTGLLKGFTPKDHADLYAYLKSISHVRNASTAKETPE
jgi:putative membrane-bound dehydrogenase-like protein